MSLITKMPEFYQELCRSTLSANKLHSNSKKEMREIIIKIKKTRSWFFKMNKIDKPLARLIKEKREKSQIKKK